LQKRKHILVSSSNFFYKFANVRYLWYTSIAFGLFGLLCAVCVREMDFLLTDHIEVDLTKVKKMNQGVSDKELEAVRTEAERR
jgi:hypothetical protein